MAPRVVTALVHAKDLRSPRAPSSMGVHRDLPPLEELGSSLRTLSRVRAALGLAVPFVFVLAYGILAAHRWWTLATACVGAFSLVSYASVSHDLVHRTLGFSRTASHLALSSIELLGLRSGTAYRVVHLQHHRAFPGPDDIEAHRAVGSLRGALWAGVVGPIACWRWAYVRHPELRRRLLGEAASIAAIVAAAVWVRPWTPAPLVYVALTFGAGLTLPLATVYLPHRASSADAIHQTRLFRGWFWSLLFNEHMYHLEHHLYPAVPHQHWPELARRLDPHFQRLGVVPFRPW